MSEEHDIQRAYDMAEDISMIVNHEKEYVAVTSLIMVLWTIREQTNDVESFDLALQSSVDMIIGIK